MKSNDYHSDRTLNVEVLIPARAEYGAEGVGDKPWKLACVCGKRFDIIFLHLLDVIMEFIYFRIK